MYMYQVSSQYLKEIQRLRKVRKTEWTDGQTGRRKDGRTKGRADRKAEEQTN